MAEEISPNKLDDTMKRKAEHVRDRLQDQGVGRDEAEKRAVEEAYHSKTSGGGGHSGGDPKQGHNHEHDNRRGSDKGPG